MLRFLQNKIAPATRALKVSRAFHVPIADYVTVGERDAVLASSGMGKSYLTGVLMEETMENGGLICVIDPEGEHFTLAEKYPMLVVGGVHGNLPLEVDAIDIYIEAMLNIGLSAVFDLSEYLDSEQQQLYAHIADKLFHAEQKYRRKIRVVVEEAQIYAPQRQATVTTKTKKGQLDPVLASQRLAKRGRKRAIDSLWATQRPASISKDILSQCNRFWFGGITAEQDYKAIKPFLTEAGISFSDLKRLNPGEFYFYGKGQTKLLQVRKRICKHAGATPEAGMQFQAASDKSLDLAVSRLAEQIAQRAEEKAQEESENEKLKTRIKKLEDDNLRLRKELEQEQLATRVIERLDGGAFPSVMSAGVMPGPGALSGAKRPRRGKKTLEEHMNAQIEPYLTGEKLHPTHVDLSHVDFGSDSSVESEPIAL
jgi:uncharacterized protein